MKTVEYTKDENGLIVGIKVDGKAVKAGSMRGFKKAQTAVYWTEITEPETVENRFSGKKVELTALEATIYNFCNEWYRRYSNNPMALALPIQTYDDMKYFLMELNPRAYYDLMD